MFSRKHIGAVAALVAVGLVAAGVLVVGDEQPAAPVTQPAPRGLDDQGDLRLIRQTPTRIVLGWTPELTGFGYLFSGDGTVVARTTDPARSTATFRNIYTSYEVAAIDKGDTGTYSPLAGTLTMTVTAETANTITFGWTPQAEYGYLFSGDGDVISRTYDPNRSYAKFNKSYTDYEVAVLVKGVTGTYPSSPPVSITCDQSSTSAADFTNDLAAINNGETLCLTNAVDYGTFTGTTKNITIVSQAASGVQDPVNNTLALTLGSGDTGTVTIDGGMDRWDTSEGLNIVDAGISTGAANLTVTDFKIDPDGGCDPPNDGGRCWLIDPAPINSNILIDHFIAQDATDGEALFYIDDGATSGDTGVIIQNGLFRHMSTDGFKLTGNESVTVRNNKFMDMHGSYDTGGEENHTDAIQMLEGNHVIYGNWLSGSDQCIFSDDGTDNNTIHHNVVDNCGQHFITVSADGPTGSTHSFNTITVRTQDLPSYFECGNNRLDSLPQAVPDIQNNIYQAMNLGGTGGGVDCVPVANHHNMLKPGEPTDGTGGSNFTGTQTYVGGADISTFDAFADFCLVDGSAGEDDATDGGQVGACGGDYNGTNYGPPSGEGY